MGYAVHDVGYEDSRWADPDYKHTTAIIGCTNNTDLYATIWCMGGIIGTDFNNVTIENCVNNGLVSDNSTEGDGRVGGIIGYDQGNTTITGCESYGAVHSLDAKKTCVGGITSVIAGNSNYTNNKVNCVISGQHTTKGIFVANVNNKNAVFSGNLAKGSVATSYNKGEYTDKVDVTEENFSTYVGNNGKSAPTFSTGVSFWK